MIHSAEHRAGPDIIIAVDEESGHCVIAYGSMSHSVAAYLCFQAVIQSEGIDPLGGADPKLIIHTFQGADIDLPSL